MKSHETADRRVDHLVERLKDDALNENEVAEVQDIIRNQPQARRRFVQLLFLAADLREVVGNWHGQATFSRETHRGLRAAWASVAVFAAAAAIVLMVWQPWAPQKGAGGNSVAAAVIHDPAADAIAVITRVRNPKWAESTTLPMEQLVAGDLMSAGALELVSGLVQIDFYSGATVILEGPAKFHVDAPDSGRLDYGNLWAHVPPPARGFRIESSNFDLVDLGTEFGMRVNRAGDGEVHVLKGEVEFVPKAGSGAERLLKTGQGMELAADGKSQEIIARPDIFTASDQLDAEASASFKRWQIYQTKLRNDPDTLVYYDFQNLSNWDRTLPNVAAAGVPNSDGAIVGCKPSAGRWPGKGALAYTNSSHRVRLDVRGTFQDLTLSCWFRMDSQASPEVALLHPQTKQDYFIHWGLVNVNGGAAHSHFSQSFPAEGVKKQRRHYHCDWNLLRMSKVGHWMNLSLVFDSEAGKVSHYQNGELIGVQAIEDNMPLGIGISDIGNWPFQEWATGTQWEVRNMVGAIDEFLIMKRPLSEDEISELWEAGRP